MNLRIPFVEDGANDAEVMLRGLGEAGIEPQWERVQTEAELCRQNRHATAAVARDPGAVHCGALRYTAVHHGIREAGSDARPAR